MPSKLFYLLTSAVLHSLVIFFLLSLSDQSKLKKQEFIEINYIQKPKILEKDLAKVTEKKIKIEKIKEKKIVDQEEQALNDEIPSKTDFLGKHNQKVLKQTISKNHGEFKNLKSKKIEKIKIFSMEDLKPSFNFTPNKKLNSMSPKTEPDEKNEKLSKNLELKKEDKKQTVAPNENLLNPVKEADQSQTLDYIKELDPGLETMLSTKEFVYYSYFSRIRNQLNQYWSPKVHEKLNKLFHQGRMIASDEDKITKCLIILDRKGNLMKIQIISQSGIRDLDEAAVEAFKSAAPFPNPPSGIVDDDGTIKIRWDFVLEA